MVEGAITFVDLPSIFLGPVSVDYEKYLMPSDHVCSTYTEMKIYSLIGTGVSLTSTGWTFFEEVTTDSSLDVPTSHPHHFSS